MFVNTLNNLNKNLYPKYVEKVKPIILKRAYFLKISSGFNNCYIDTLEDCSKIRPYSQLNFNIIESAIKELENEGKIIINKDTSPLSFTLTEDTFNYLSNNKHPFKTWFKNNIFNILNFIIGLWGAVTGTLALFFK